MRYLTGFHAIEELIKSGKAVGPLLVANAGPRARTIVSLALDTVAAGQPAGTWAG